MTTVMLDEIYFTWLCAKVLQQPSHDPTYKRLLEILYRTEFVYDIIGDRNRAEDGCELRTYFLVEFQTDKDEGWFTSPCSVLEVLIAFAQKAEFQTSVSAHSWFWTFLTNLGLNEYRRVDRRDERDIHEILETWMFRRFASNGVGSILPLEEPTRDQTQIELWFQLCDYIYEMGLL